MNVLLIENNDETGINIHDLLVKNNYLCDYIHNLNSIEEKWLHADIAVISRDLHDKNCIQYIPNLLTIKGIPVIIISQNNNTEDRILCFRAGARDYISKPFCENELLIRLEVQLRPIGESKIIYNDIIMNLSNNTTFYQDSKIDLSNKESKLLAFFISHPNRLCSRDEVLKKVWGYKSIPSTRTVDNHILSLRKKIPSLQIETVRGCGYKLVK